MKLFANPAGADRRTENRPATEGSEDASDGFRVDDERARAMLERRVGPEIRQIVADPFLLLLVPPESARRVPWLVRYVTGSAIVEDTAVHRPRPSPIRVIHAAGIFEREVDSHISWKRVRRCSVDEAIPALAKHCSHFAVGSPYPARLRAPPVLLGSHFPPYRAVCKRLGAVAGAGW
jgi:hypothetical protein